MKRIHKIENSILNSRNLFAIKDSHGIRCVCFDNLKYWNEGASLYGTINFKILNEREGYYAITFVAETGELKYYINYELYELEDYKDFAKLQLTEKLSR